jgi:hypothetical protein
MLVFFRLKSKLSIKVVENNFLVQQIVKYLASANISHGHDENIGVTHIQDTLYELFISTRNFLSNVPHINRLIYILFADEDNSVIKIRRTERTRRERPDFFNPLLLENPVKRPRKKVQ